MRRHSLSNATLRSNFLKPLPTTISPIKSLHRPPLQSYSPPRKRVESYPSPSEPPLLTCTSRPQKLPPMPTKLVNQYLVRQQTIPSSDDGSRYLQQIHTHEKKEPKHLKPSLSKLIGEDAKQTYYNFYKNMDKEKKKGDAVKKQALLQILDILQRHDFPPQTMNLIRQKGREDILYMRGFGLLSDKRKNVLEQITSKISFFTKAVLSHNCLSNLSFLSHLTNLQDLDLSNNNLSTPCIPTLKSYFTKTFALQILNLENNFLFDSASAQLIEELTIYKKITVLNLSRNGLANKAAKALKQLFTNRTELTELYLHWNEFDQECGRDLFLGLEENKKLRVLDLSWNYLGGKKPYTKYMAESIQKLTCLVHLDLSFCNFGEQQSKLLSSSFDKNHTIYGLHFQGNYGYINHKGFLICEDNREDTLTKMKYPLPVNTNYGLKRINGIQPNSQRYYFRSERSTKDICWICQSWVEIEFQFAFQMDPNIQYFAYFGFESFKGVKLSKDGSIIRMCPRGDIEFFFSKFTMKGNQYFVSENYQTKEKEMNGAMAIINGSLEQVGLKTVNIMKVSGKHPIDDDYQPDVYNQPRVHDNNNKGFETKNQIRKKKKKAGHQQPKPYKTLPPFDFTESPFQDWKFLSDQSIDKCIEFDFRQSKLQNLFQEIESSWGLKQSLRPYYRILTTIYYELASHCRLRNNYFAYPAQLKDLLLSVDICDKRLPLSVLTILFSTVIPKIHEFELDVDYSAKNVMTTFQTINRPQFFELIYRIAYEKYTKKPKQYLLDKMAKKSQQDMTESKVKFEFDRGEDTTESQIMTVNKNRVYLPLKQALTRIAKQLQPHYHKIDSHVFRVSCVWTSPVNLVLQNYQPFTKPLYMKYIHYTTKFKIKQPGMYFEDWINIFASSGLAQQDNKPFSKIFLVCKMVEVEEGTSPPQLQYCEFIQSIVRVAEILSLPNPFRKDVNGVHNTQYPLCFKLEYLILYLYKTNTDLNNKFIKRLLEKGGLFSQQFSEFLLLASKGYEQPVQPFTPNPKGVTLEQIIQSQRLKHQKHLEELALEQKLQKQRHRQSNIIRQSSEGSESS